MNAETLLALARDYATWLRKSVDLRASADVLWTAYESEAVRWARQQSINTAEADAAWRRAMAHLDSAKMLYALALETAFKSVIIRDRPSEVHFNINTDGSGKFLFAELMQIGSPKKASHRLSALAEKTDVFDRGANPIFADDADVTSARAIIDDLSNFSTWIARYPTPMRADQDPNYPAPPLSHAWGDQLRHWTDPILDHLHGLNTREGAAVSTRREVYAQEWLEAHNDCLKRHPAYRSDMSYTQTTAAGDLVLGTCDKVLSDADRRIFEEVSREVASTHKLIVP